MGSVGAKTCGSCRFWDTTSAESRAYDLLSSGLCKKIKAAYELEDLPFTPPNKSREDYDTCEEELAVKTEFFRSQHAFVKDGDDYHAELRTYATFGCILHETIESETS